MSDHDVDVDEATDADDGDAVDGAIVGSDA